MAETSCAKVDLVLSSYSEELAHRRWREKRHLFPDKVRLDLVSQRVITFPSGRMKKRGCRFEVFKDTETHYNATHQWVLQQGFPLLKIDVRSSGQVCSLLKEDSIWPEDFAYIYCHFLIGLISSARGARGGKDGLSRIGIWIWNRRRKLS